MIDCPNGDVRDVLPDYVNDRLGTHRRAEVERHLESCAACRDEVSLLRGLRTTIRRAPMVDVDAIAAAIPPYRAPVRRRWTTGWRAAAAIAAIVVGGTSIALLRDDAPTDRGARPAAISQAPAPTGDPTPASGVPSVTQTPSNGAPANPTSAPPPRELAMAGGSIGELSDVELAALVNGLESLDALPLTEVDGTQPPPLSAQEGS